MRPKIERNEYEQLGTILRERRKELGLSQAEIAEKVGVLRVNITQIEGGKRGVSYDTLIKYCKVLKLKVDFKKIT